jgi:hypothetical protein
MRARLILTLAVAAAVMAAVVGGTAAAPGNGQGPKEDLVAGTGQSTFQSFFGPLAFFLHVDAHSGPAGEDPRGHFILRRSGGAPSLPQLDIHGDITCLNVVGNTAGMNGVITKSETPSLPPGTQLYISIVDNGEGNKNPPDTFGLNTAIPLFACPPGSPATVQPVEQGNYVVKDVT